MLSQAPSAGVLLVVVVHAARHRDARRARDVRLAAPPVAAARARRARAPRARRLGHALPQLRPQRRRDLAQDARRRARRRPGRGTHPQLSRVYYQVIWYANVESVLVNK